jgi:hypothetical protein
MLSHGRIVRLMLLSINIFLVERGRESARNAWDVAAPPMRRGAALACLTGLLRFVVALE